MANKRTSPPSGDIGSSNLKTLVGSTFLTRINDNEHPPLRIGTQRWTTHQLAVQLGVVHTKAARLLSDAAASIGAKSVRDLYDKSTPYTFAGLRGLGETTLYVLWRLFQSQGLDPDKWAASGDRDETLVSFRSLKHREQAGEKRTLDAAQKRHPSVSRRTLAADSKR
jgi:hypothetical protein